MKNLEVLSIDYGPLDFVKPLRKNEEHYRGLFPGIDLPKDLVGKYWLFINGGYVEVKARVYVDNKPLVRIYRLDIKAGFYFDLASVPKYIRSLFDDNDPRVLVAALFHDAGFILDFPGYDDCSQFFKQMIRKEGGSWWLATKGYWGVNNWVAERRYYEHDRASIEVVDKKLIDISII